MNIATDLIEREHQDIDDHIAEFERTGHRSSAFDLCSAIERHGAMENEVLRPVLADVDADTAAEHDREHDSMGDLIDRVRHASDRDELRSLVTELAASMRDHARDEEERLLPAMEDELGVARMNELGIALLDWQHEQHRLDRESEDQLEDLLSMTRAELYERAREVDLDGRSTMRKMELAEALADR